MKRLIDNLKVIRERNERNQLILKMTFIITGILSTIWFLIRVIPKPQRAAYPCMRTAAPVMSSFVIYLLTIMGTFKAFSKVKLNVARANYGYTLIFLFLTIAGLLAISTINTEKIFARSNAEWVVKPNAPLGIGKGIFPGRVVWIHDPAVATWDGKTGNWWDDKVVSQTESDKMMRTTLTTLTGQKSEKNAWVELFRSFNQSKKRKDLQYLPQQKIAVKINTNNTYGHQDSEEINATPQMVLSLIRSLVSEAGVPQKNITVFDASRFITDNIFKKCHAVYPDVIFLDNIGGDGRTKSTYQDNAIPYSKDNGKLAQGLAKCAVEADYLINMALLKGHVGQGVTLCAKNYYGVTSINNDWRKNAHNNFDQNREGKSKYMTFVDFLAHKDLGDKTMLFLIDGVYGCKLVNGGPGPKLQMAPFNNNWACSLLASQDPVAIDAVGLDILRSEWPDMVDLAFSDQYLIEAAMANNPPSGTIYDPEKDNTKVSTSLGVMEHWNNSKDMKYSRNLGKKEGIELVTKSL